MSGSSSLLRKFIPLGNWNPDAVEFAVGILDQLANAIPVFGVYRTMQRTRELSTCPEDRRVTGTYVHRISTDQSLDIMQPSYSEPSPPGDPKVGFQALPSTLVKAPLYDGLYLTLRGMAADASKTLLLIPQGAPVELFGLFETPHREWDGVSPLVVSFQYRIRSGFTGAYEFNIDIGTTDVSDPANPANFTSLTGGLFTVSGMLQTDGDDALVLDTVSILAVDLPANPHLSWYAWRIVHEIDAEGTGEQSFSPVAVSSADPIDRQSGNVSYFMNEQGSRVAAEMFPSINDSDDGTFIESRPIYSTEGGGKGFWFKCEIPPLFNMQDHRIVFRWSVSSLAQEVSLAMYEGLGGREVQRWTGIGAASPNTVTEFEINNQGPGGPAEGVNPAFIGTIQDWSNVWFFFFAHIPTIGGVVTKTLRPESSYQEFPAWTLLAGASKLAAISDDSDLTGIQSPAQSTTSPAGTTAVDSAIFVKVQAFDGPAVAISAVRVYVKCRYVGIPGLRLKMTIRDIVTGATWDSGGNEGVFFEITGGVLAPYEWNVSPTGNTVITNWDQVQMIVSVMDDSFGQLQISDIWIEVDSGVSSVAKLYKFEYFAPEPPQEGADAPIDISWLRADGPATIETVQQDDLRLYAGTVEEPQSATQEGKIYELESPDFVSWNDVSQAGGYNSNARDKSWHFTGFGSLVVATNYADEVQVKSELDAAFRDLIGFDFADPAVAIPDYEAMGGVYPRARFAATINAFLCLANCDPSSVAGVAQPYSFWCSRYAQPNYFAIGKIEWQSSVFQQLATTGEITGLTGGEWGLIFKENSVWRADYDGLPKIFDFTQITGMQGTVQPRSIVRVDDDIYFSSTGGIYVIRGGQKLEEIAEAGSVRKFLFDSQFEEFGISTFLASLESESNVRVVGGYDAYTGCVFWSYLTARTGDDDWFKCDAIIVYNPRDGRFGFVAGDGGITFSDDTRIVGVADLFETNTLQLSGFFSLGNRQVGGQTYLLKTILATTGIPPKLVSFSGSPTYEQFFRSGTIPSSAFGAKPGNEIVLHKIRPVLAVERNLKAPAHTIWIEANQSPAIGDGTGTILSVDSGRANSDGWIDLGVPLSGEFFKIATVFRESIDPILKEFHGWQFIYRISGER